ncbi:MAG TPA: NlpC/P60 family protein [Bacillota bacterium]|nr:NlpC/P60 family protein [Bacillota bacterium]
MTKFKKVLLGSLLCCLVLTCFAGIASAAASGGAKVTASGVNLRSGPGTTYKVKANLTKGQSLVVLGQEGSWYKVSAGSTVGWVKKDFITVTPPALAVNAAGVNLRTGPGTTYKVKATLTKGTKVTVLQQQGIWCKVSTPAKTVGWVTKQYLGSINKSAVSRGGARTTSAPEGVIDYARQFLGVKYVWAGTSPSGFDCSGFTRYVYQKFGVQLDHSSAAQSRTGSAVNKADLSAGDLVFFDTNGGHSSVNHVGIYIGGGRFIHASSGQGEVTINSLNEGFYAGTYLWARSVK